METNTVHKGKVWSDRIWEKSGRRNKSIIHHDAFSNPGHIPSVLPFSHASVCWEGRSWTHPQLQLCAHPHWYPRALLEWGPPCSHQNNLGRRSHWAEEKLSSKHMPSIPLALNHSKTNQLNCINTQNISGSSLCKPMYQTRTASEVCRDRHGLCFSQLHYQR